LVAEERKPTRDELVPLLNRATSLARIALEPETLASVSEVFQVVRWQFVDHDLDAYLVIDEAGGLSVVSQPPREADGTIKLEAAVLHDVALGKMPMAMAFLGGKMRLQGLPALKMRRFIPLFKPFLEGYRQAWQEIKEG